MWNSIIWYLPAIFFFKSRKKIYRFKLYEYRFSITAFILDLNEKRKVSMEKLIFRNELKLKRGEREWQIFLETFKLVSRKWRHEMEDHDKMFRRG